MSKGHFELFKRTGVKIISRTIKWLKSCVIKLNVNLTCK